MDYNTSLDLTILSILKEYSDKSNKITQRFIREELDKRGMPVERRTLSRHLASINSFFQENKHSGFGIVKHTEKARTFKNKDTGENEDSSMTTDLYYKSDFSEEELHLLIDSVVFSKHIPNSDRKSIIEKIERLASGRFKTKSKFIEVINNVTAQNDSLPENVKIIHNAIQTETKIDFTYNEYGSDKKLHPIGEHTVNPYRIAAANDHYYLICNEEPFDNCNNYRIDRITNLKTIDGEHFAPLRPLNTKQYLATHLYMLPGEAQHVKMIVDKAVIGDVIDYFGDEFRIVKTENERLEIWIQSNVDDIYYWALQYGNHVEIIEPQELRDRIRVTVETMSKTYLTSDDDKYEKAVERAKKKHWLVLTYTNAKKKTFEEVPADITGLMLIGNVIDNTEFLNKFTELITIHISDQEVRSFEFLEKQKNLRDLTIGFCGFFDLKHIKNCENLQYLVLHDNKVGSLDVLFELPKLKSLNITSELAEKIDVASLKKKNPKLQVELNK